MQKQESLDNLFLAAGVCPGRTAGRFWHVWFKPDIPLAARIEVFLMVLRRNPGTPAALRLAGAGKRA